MELTRQRKIAIGVLGLAVAALLIDRGLIMGGGQAASAAPVESTAARAQSPTATPESSIGQNRLAEKLREIAESEKLALAHVDDDRGAFATPEAFGAKEKNGPAAAPQREGQLFSVSSVLTANGGGYAVIDGKLVGVGQPVADDPDEGVLVGVTSKSARIAIGDEIVEFFVLDADEAERIADSQRRVVPPVSRQETGP